MKTITRAALGATAIAAVALGPTAAAHADPVNAPGSLLLTLTCDNGITYQAVTNGNGHWTPAHDVNGQTTLIPLSFGTQTFTLYDPAGNIVDQETVAPSAKGALDSNKHATAFCTFTGSQTAPDGSTFVLDGSVIGIATPNGQ